MADEIRMGNQSGAQELGAWLEKLAPGNEIREWLDVQPAETRSWTIRCMTSTSGGGVGRLKIDPATYGVLLRAGIVTIADLRRRAGHDMLDGIPGIGARRVARIRNALEAYERDNRQ